MPVSIRIDLKKQTNVSYDIQIGVKLQNAIREINEIYPLTQKFLITDSHVNKLYGKAALGAYYKNKEMFKLLVVPAGESSKSRATKELLEDKLISLNITRDSLIIALGGGMIGDLAGFISATLLRGIPYVQIPTTLLAQVDSSIGGKVAINHPSGKNLIGAFYQPKKVYIDINTLTTLSQKEFRNGMAEVIKYAAILDKQLFSYLQKYHRQIMQKNKSTLVHIIKRCCELKKSVVEKDETETGLRRVLNFGHTIGHALEILSRHKISHGEAVSIGIAEEAQISVSIGLLKRTDFEILINLLRLYKLPTVIPDKMEIREIVCRTLHDKKIHEGEVHYTLLERIGKARPGVKLPTKEVEQYLRI